MPHNICSTVRIRLLSDSRSWGMGWGINGVMMIASASDKIIRTRTVRALLSSTGT